MMQRQEVVATAPGKVILFGEHAVVYGRPAIAVPVTQVRATAVVRPGAGDEIRLVATDLGRDLILTEAQAIDPLAATLRRIQEAAGVSSLPGMTISISSQIPIASGLGSGAAVTVAIIRAVAEYLGLSAVATREWISALAYEVEKIHHGTPSGIDNTVVTYELPVYFMRQKPQNRIETFTVAVPLRLLVADSGLPSHTKAVVADVRQLWLGDRGRFEDLFDQCGDIANGARLAIERGNLGEVGRLMNLNQGVLREITVSSPLLERLVEAAAHSGALGAKLSGAGRGGNMIALVTAETEEEVRQALLSAGARTVLSSVISA